MRGRYLKIDLSVLILMNHFSAFHFQFWHVKFVHRYYSISVSAGKVYKTKGKIFSAIHIHVAINNIACGADCWNAFLTKQEIVHERNFSAIRRRSRSIFRYHVDIFHVEIVASTGSNGANSAELRTYSKADPFHYSTQVIRTHGSSAKDRFLFVNVNFFLVSLRTPWTCCWWLRCHWSTGGF